jgi:hypothetical protein
MSLEGAMNIIRITHANGLISLWSDTSDFPHTHVLTHELFHQARLECSDDGVFCITATTDDGHRFIMARLGS